MTASDQSFKQFIMNKQIEVSEIADPEVKKQIDELTNGCFVLAYQTNHKGGGR